jgi:hypothetical protein
MNKNYEVDYDYGVIFTAHSKLQQIIATQNLFQSEGFDSKLFINIVILIFIYLVFSFCCFE